MHSDLDDSVLREVSDRLSEQMGLHFPENRFTDLQQGLASAAHDLEIDGASACAHLILSGGLLQRQVEVLASHLTVGETYFFRDTRSFEVLEQLVLPELIAGRPPSDRRLRIWCAGCSSGEEPYSIAMVLRRVIRNLSEWNLQIIATDMNPGALRKALRGEYREWSFRSTPPEIRDRYFDRVGEREWRIASEVRQMVTFSYLNLARDTYPSTETNTNAMDIVFCRNVLMYFAPHQARAVAERLQRAVSSGGWLFVGQSEASRSLFSKLSPADVPGLILFRRSSGPPSRLADHVSKDTSSVQHGSAGRVRRPEVASKPAGRQRHSANDRTRRKPADLGLSDARALWSAGRGREAERIALRLLQHQSRSDILELIARICADDGRIEDALHWCLKAIESDRLNPSPRFLKASVLQELGDDTAAVQALREVLYLAPDHALAHYALANHYRRMGRPNDAALHFKNALSFLSGYRAEDILPGADGVTAGWLSDIIRSVLQLGSSTYSGGGQE